MNRSTKRIIWTLAAVLASAALAPTASAAESGGGPNERSATELGQAVGEPGEQGDAAADARYSRTPTERAQSAWPSVATGAGPSGFAWGDAAIGAGSALALALIAFGGVALVGRGRRDIQEAA